MAGILEFFEMYGTWIVVGAIIILLAIIGRYADKTNFGQNKKNEELDKIDEIENNLELEKKLEVEKVQQIEKQNLNSDEILEQELEQSNNVVSEESTLNQELSSNVNNQNVSELNEKTIRVHDNIEGVENKVSFEEQYNELDKEIDSLLPKKEIIDEDLLDDIDNLSLDKTQKINITDIPDLDDVDLPEIKKLSQYDEDIWKF